MTVPALADTEKRHNALDCKLHIIEKCVSTKPLYWLAGMRPSRTGLMATNTDARAPAVAQWDMAGGAAALAAGLGRTLADAAIALGGAPLCRFGY